MPELKNLPLQPFYSLRLVQTPKLGRTLAWWCIGLLVIMVSCLFLPWTQNIRSSGELLPFSPENRPQTVHTVIAGQIARWHVREGQRVRKGDTLITISEVKEKYFDPALLPRMQEQITAKVEAQQASEDKVKALESQIAALEQGLEVSLGKARNKVRQNQLKLQSDSADQVAQRIELRIAQDQLQRQEQLYAQGLKSLTEVEARRLKAQETQAKAVAVNSKLGSSRQEMSNARLELQSLRAEYQDKIAKARSELNATRSYVHQSEAEISKMRGELAGTRVRSGFYQVTAPQAGVVVNALRTGVGQMLKEGEAIAVIMPQISDLAVALYVKPMDIPLLHVGDPVRLQFDGWPALVFSGWPGATFGTFAGVIAVIDNVASEGKYRLLITPDPKHGAWPEPLRVGGGAYGWMLLDDVPVGYELWRQLNGFPPNYVPSAGSNKAAKSMEKPDKAVPKDEEH